ncbi:AraC family transcriptional regulator [Chelativorans sp.]|uniref:helix-turn-helix transcriptional regulator n=1 Tax=Chelativorans sp. TaxID=2203393 RepID=UPI002811C5A6|nr:AraC family transcriptional regulator [Chelativorans sp.]
MSGDAAAAVLTVRPLLETATVKVRDLRLRSAGSAPSEEQCAGSTHLVFPYRGTFVRHLGRKISVGEPSQVLFYNEGDAYRLSLPLGECGSLAVTIHESLLRELAPKGLLRDDATAFQQARLRIDARAQVLVALLRHGLHQATAELLEAESLALTLVQRALGPRTSHAAGATLGRQQLADRAKLVLASDLARRWSLAEVAAEVGCSPVYLTQVFRQVEGMPLYRYQLRMRLARALDLLTRYDDLTALSLELGFSSHSHFSAAFREVYRRSPSDFRQMASQR